MSSFKSKPLVRDALSGTKKKKELRLFGAKTDIHSRNRTFSEENRKVKGRQWDTLLKLYKNNKLAPFNPLRFPCWMDSTK